MGQAKPVKPKDLEVEIEVTLEELYSGALKTISYTKDEVKHDAKTTVRKSMSQQV